MRLIRRICSAGATLRSATWLWRLIRVSLCAHNSVATQALPPPYCRRFSDKLLSPYTPSILHTALYCDRPRNSTILPRTPQRPTVPPWFASDGIRGVSHPPRDEIVCVSLTLDRRGFVHACVYASAHTCVIDRIPEVMWVGMPKEDDDRPLCAVGRCWTTGRSQVLRASQQPTIKSRWRPSFSV